MQCDDAILVTGAETLIGSAIARRLRDAGHTRVSAVDSASLRESTSARSAVKEAQDGYVFDASGTSGGIKLNMEKPADLMFDNLYCAANLLTAAHAVGVKKLLYLASSCGYPRVCDQPMREASLFAGPVEPTSAPYATAKLAGLVLAQAYRKQYGDDFVVGVPANAYGPGDDFSPEGGHVIASLMQRFHRAKLRKDASVQVWGTGTPRRQFIYVDDLADACIFAMRHYSDASPINLGAAGDISIRELADILRRTVGFAGELAFDATKPDGAPLKSLDTRKLDELGFRPSWTIERGIEETYRWFVQNEPRSADLT